MQFLKNAHYQFFEEIKLKKILTAFAGKKVLDYGCGLGKYLRVMKEIGVQAAGIDINAQQVDALKEEGFDACTSLDNLQKESFDCILLSHIIEHLSGDNVVKLFDSLLPYLKKDGTIIIVTPVLGERFYYDFTHIRPYYPQSVRMLFGGIKTPMSTKSQYSAELEDIFFFKDSFKLRLFQAFYPTSSASPAMKKILSMVNLALAWLHYYSGGRIGRTASWLGIYKVKGSLE